MTGINLLILLLASLSFSVVVGEDSDFDELLKNIKSMENYMQENLNKVESMEFDLQENLNNAENVDIDLEELYNIIKSKDFDLDELLKNKKSGMFDLEELLKDVQSIDSDIQEYLNNIKGEDLETEELLKDMKAWNSILQEHLIFLIRKEKELRVKKFKFGERTAFYVVGFLIVSIFTCIFYLIGRLNKRRREGNIEKTSDSEQTATTVTSQQPAIAQQLPPECTVERLQEFPPQYHQSV